LKDDDVETFSVADADDVIMVIWVPSAKREQKPVNINDDSFGGIFRRNWEGDYHCTRLQVKTMLRDQAEETMDMEVLEEAEIEDLNQESIRGYRNSHKSFKPGHPFERLDDKEYLRVIGAAGLSKEDKRLHPTAARMLMFGNEYDIQIKHFHQTLISWVRFSSSAHLLLPRSDIARILKYNFIFLFDYKNAIFSIKICIDHTVCQRFPQRSVNRRIIHTKTAFHSEWYFDIFRNFIVYTKIKVKYISRPFAG